MEGTSGGPTGVQLAPEAEVACGGSRVVRRMIIVLGINAICDKVLLAKSHNYSEKIPT